MRIARDGRRQHARAVAGRPASAGARAEGAQAADGDDRCGARPRASYRWALTLFPTHAYAAEAGMSLDAVRGLLLPAPAWRRRRPGHRLAAPVRRGQAPGRVDRGQGGGPHHGPGHRHQARRGRAHVHPLRRRAQHARRRVLHRPVEDSVERRGRVLVPGHLRRPRGGRRQASSSRTARSSTPRPSGARSS